MISCSELNDLVFIDDSVASMGVFIAYTSLWLNEWPSDPGHIIDSEIEKLIEHIREKYSLETLRVDPVVKAFRKFYWSIGIDPTKKRPSAEALVRRILRNGIFPRINPVVDAGNIVSVYTLIPIGLYDLDRVKPPLKLILSRGGEAFIPIGSKDKIILESNIPILIDSNNTVLHLYPHRDSYFSRITKETRKILVIAAGVPGIPRGLVAKAISIIGKLFKLLGGKVCNEIIIK